MPDSKQPIYCSLPWPFLVGSYSRIFDYALNFLTCLYPCILLGVLAVYSCAPVVKRDSCVACVPVRLARGYTPRLHLNVVAELAGEREASQLSRYPLVLSWRHVVLHSGEGDRVFFPAHFTQAKISGREMSRNSIRGQRIG